MTAEVDPHPNWRHLGSGFFLVRTQAGFKQAARSYAGQDWTDALENIEGHPSSYPAVCVFGIAYRGFHYLTATCTHVSSLRTALQEE